MAEPTPVYITLVSPLAASVVGLLAVGIAFLQLKLAHNKLKLDLFDRRYKVYDHFRKFLSVILREANFKDSDLWEFYGGTSDTEFLFGPEISEYHKEIRTRALNMRLYAHKFSDLPVGAERSGWVQKNHDELVWLTQQLNELKPIFSPYLSFSKINGLSFFDKLARGAKVIRGDSPVI